MNDNEGMTMGMTSDDERSPADELQEQFEGRYRNALETTRVAMDEVRGMWPCDSDRVSPQNHGHLRRAAALLSDALYELRQLEADVLGDDAVMDRLGIGIPPS